MKGFRDAFHSIFKSMVSELRLSLIITFSLSVVLCGIYPLVVWVLASGIFPEKANGSLVVSGGKVLGAAIIAQGFTSPRYFHPRPSAAGQGYDALASGGSNLGPTSQKLVGLVEERITQYRLENGLAVDVPVPADAVMASGSGLDPHISTENALLQAGRVASARGVSAEEIHRKIEAHTEGRDLGILGNPRVNVLLLNLDLDGIL